MEIHGLDDNQPLTQTEDKKETSVPKNIKKWIGLGIFIVVVIFSMIYNKVYQAKKEKEEEQAQITQSELDAIMNDPHLQRGYYLNTVRSEYTNQSAAELIAHVILTGCKDSYESLREYFDADSMKYLYSFLGGYSCEEWKQVPCSLQERGVDFEDYKVIVASKEQYLIHIKLDKDAYPKSYSISNYLTGMDILEATQGDISGEMEVKDHSHIEEFTEPSSEITTVGEDAEVSNEDKNKTTPKKQEGQDE